MKKAKAAVKFSKKTCVVTARKKLRLVLYGQSFSRLRVKKLLQLTHSMLGLLKLQQVEDLLFSANIHLVLYGQPINKKLQHAEAL